MINFINSTRLVYEMYQELELKEDNYLFTEEIINEIRASYNLNPIELQEHIVNIVQESHDIIEQTIYCEQLTEGKNTPSLFITEDINETRVSKRIASTKFSTKKDTKKTSLQPKNFEFVCHICSIEFKGLRPLAVRIYLFIYIRINFLFNFAFRNTQKNNTIVSHK